MKTLLDLDDELARLDRDSITVNGHLARLIGYTCRQEGRERTPWWRRPDGHRIAPNWTDNHPPNFVGHLEKSLQLLPSGWWLAGLRESRTRIVLAGDLHRSNGEWVAAVQHETGGLLTQATAMMPSAAVCRACVAIRRLHPEHCPS